MASEARHQRTSQIAEFSGLTAGSWMSSRCCRVAGLGATVASATGSRMPAWTSPSLMRLNLWLSKGCSFSKPQKPGRTGGARQQRWSTAMLSNHCNGKITFGEQRIQQMPDPAVQIRPSVVWSTACTGPGTLTDVELVVIHDWQAIGRQVQGASSCEVRGVVLLQTRALGPVWLRPSHGPMIFVLSRFTSHSPPPPLLIACTLQHGHCSERNSVCVCAQFRLYYPGRHFFAPTPPRTTISSAAFSASDSACGVAISNCSQHKRVASRPRLKHCSTALMSAKVS